MTQARKITITETHVSRSDVKIEHAYGGYREHRSPTAEQVPKLARAFYDAMTEEERIAFRHDIAPGPKPTLETLRASLEAGRDRDRAFKALVALLRPHTERGARFDDTLRRLLDEIAQLRALATPASADKESDEQVTLTEAGESLEHVREALEASGDLDPSKTLAECVEGLAKERDAWRTRFRNRDAEAETARREARDHWEGVVAGLRRDLEAAHAQHRSIVGGMCTECRLALAARDDKPEGARQSG